MRLLALLAALAPLALAGCGDVPVWVGDRQVYDPEAAAARRAEAQAAAAQAATTGAAPGTTAPGTPDPGTPAPGGEGLTLFGLPVYVGDRRVGTGGGNAGLPAFNVPVWVGDTQVAGPRAAP